MYGQANKVMNHWNSKYIFNFFLSSKRDPLNFNYCNFLYQKSFSIFSFSIDDYVYYVC